MSFIRIELQTQGQRGLFVELEFLKVINSHDTQRPLAGDVAEKNVVIDDKNIYVI